MNVLYFDIETTDLIEESVPIADMEIGCLCTQMVNYPTHKSMNKAYVKGYGKLDTLVAWFNFADAVELTPCCPVCLLFCDFDTL